MSIAEFENRQTQAGRERKGRTLVVVTHTHWDREWYLPFQNYRFKLVRLIDKLLDILDTEPEFKHFTLDGQTIVLEDYLEVRPDRDADLKRHIASGRLLVGPWYILPDQFLISGEAHIQNMLRGLKISREFGSAMKVGYIPDPFGHISQMPQLLRGFGIDSAIFWRGVGPEINQIEFLWEAPDGSIVQAAHLPGSANIGGYSTALAFNTGVDSALTQLEAVEQFLINRAASGVALLMNGNDHVEPTAEITRTIKRLEEIMQSKGKDYQFIHGTMPQYLELVQQSGAWNSATTPSHKGEFRDSQLAHLLPGVLSARIWIKQWNARVENLLEREAGLALAWSKTLNGHRSTYDPASLQGLYQTAWKYLLQNDPHDSVCGCSIDQVHEEMKTRYAMAEQIGTELRDEGFRIIAGAINTASLVKEPNGQPVVVFNPVAVRRSELASLQVAVSPELDDPVITDTDGTVLPHTITRLEREVLFTMDIPAFALNGMAAQAGDEGRVMGYSMTDIKFERHEEDPKIATIDITAVYNSAAPTNPKMMQFALSEAQRYIDTGVETFKLSAYRQSSIQLQFLARNVPACGYKTFVLRPRQEHEAYFEPEVQEKAVAIENEFYRVEVSPETGGLDILDKETRAVYRNANRFRDMADAGDEYNYSPPAYDAVVDGFAGAPRITTRTSALEQSIQIEGNLELPDRLSEDRQARSHRKTLCPVTTVVTLTAGSRRIDFETSFDNKVEDHRLQVLFPAPFVASESKAEGIFDVITRMVDLPKYDSSWLEDPMPQAPQKTFVSINDAEGRLSLTVMNRGLPEFEIVPPQKAGDGSAVAVTLLRAVGWLSRDDLAKRRGHAGPGLRTPGAQCPGEQHFQYGIMPHKGDWLASGAQQQAHAFNHPLTGIMGAVQGGELPDSKSFVEIAPRSLVLSTIKRSEDGQSVIVRLWNPGDADIPVSRLQFFKIPARVRLVALDEETTIEELRANEDGWVDFPVEAHKIATVRVDFK